MESYSIKYNGAELTVEGTYIPEEAEVRYYQDGSGHPGSPSDFELHSVFAGGVNITEIFYDMQLEDIIDITINSIEGR